MSLTYATYQTELVSLAKYASTADTKFQAILPGVIDYAEQRMYRELDLLAATTANTASSLVPGNRGFLFPISLVVLEQINVAPAVGNVFTRTALMPVSRDFLDNCYGDPSSTGMPKYFCPDTDQSVILGPIPDNTYRVEIVGKTRPTPLSATNTTTYLTTNLPDAFIAASMIFISGWQKNYSAQGVDPQQPVSWEQQYEKLMASANAEEQRRKFRSSAWSSVSPAPMATSNREG